MSLIYIGMDTDKMEKDILVLHCSRLQDRIAELERVNTVLMGRLHSAQSDKLVAIAKERKRWGREDLKALAIRDLEQQAKGIESVIDNSDYVYNNWLRKEVIQLRNQAKALKEKYDDK